MNNFECVRVLFKERFHAQPNIVAHAPGRVNLIGEHTDYNGGYVLPAAIEHRVAMGVSKNENRELNFYSSNYDEAYTAPVRSSRVPASSLHWANYILAVLEEFRTIHGEMPGFNIVVQGDIPIGAGLSSSAAMEICTGVAVRAMLDIELSDKDLALLCQQAEHSDYIGVKCGIMDQFASILSRKNHALFLDCHTLEYDTIPFPTDRATILIFDSRVERRLTGSEYNTRREECNEGLRLLRSLLNSDCPALPHCSIDMFRKVEGHIPDPARRRARHVITENQRVLDAVDALQSGDLVAFGRLLNQSHQSLRDDYEVSCTELDTIVSTAQQCDGVYGARLTGAGFGGCAIGVVDPDAAAGVIHTVEKTYKNRHAIELKTYKTEPAAPARAGMEAGYE